MGCGRKIGELECCSVVEGDSLNIVSQIPADLVVTDPPYGTSYSSNRQGIDRKRSNKREGDVVVRAAYFGGIAGDEKLSVEWLSRLHVVTGGAIYIFCHWTKWSELIIGFPFTLKNLIVLNKSNHGMGDLRGSYAPKHELLLFAVKGRHMLRFPNGRGKDVWDVPVRFSGARRYHPNEKPLSWVIPCIENSSDVGQLVLDPFCGSGTTLVAAKKLGRHFLGIDIEPKYCEIARQRLAELDNLR